MNAKLLCAVLAAILALTSCQSVPSNDNTTSLPVTSQEDSVVTTPDESAVTDTPSQEIEPAQEENEMRNISLGKVPDGYYSTADQQGKLIPPLIIVMPYLPSGNEWYHDTTPIFYSGELKNDLMPAVEEYYHTYAENTSDAGFEASRSHRAFGGFSAGGTTTWRVFLEGMDRFEYFMPMSGGLTLGGDGSTDVEDATLIADTAATSGYGKREYYVFSATGTRDVAYQGLTAQIEYMKTLTNAFDYTQTGFTDGNLMYYTIEGNRHDYQYTYEYVFNGLQCLFSWYERS